MDVASCLKVFESNFSTYTGDDPLDAWLKFVEYLDESLPVGDSSEISVVLNRLVQNFLSVERYADDVRFVNICIRCATYYSEPIAFFHHIFSKGVGTRTATLYVAWAQHFEHKAMTEQADAVYRKALENQARPVESIMEEYRQFQVRSKGQELLSGGMPTPPRKPKMSSDDNVFAAPTQAAAELQANGAFHVRTVFSASSRQPESGERAFVSMYSKDALASEGSELCFEEVRARTYLLKRKQKQEAEDQLRLERLLREDEEAVARLRRQLHEMDTALKISATRSASDCPTQKAFGHQEGCMETQAQENINASQENTLNISHVTPSSSLNCPHATATPSRVPPSPTVNTREALDVIMGMFQAPPLTEDPLSDLSAFVPSEKLSDDANRSTHLASFTATEPFTVYQDDVSAASHTLGKSRAARGRGLSEKTPFAVSLTGSSDVRQQANVAVIPAGCSQQDKTADEMSWLAACPNNTADFALAARCVSTPFAHKVPGDVSQDAVGTTCTGRKSDNTFNRCLQKLSPIIEQSPPDEKSFAIQPASSSAAHAGTIVGEVVAAHQMSASSATLVQAPPPPATLFFGDQTAVGPAGPVQRFAISDDLPQDSSQKAFNNASDAIANNQTLMSLPPNNQDMESNEQECHRLDDTTASQPAQSLSNPWNGDHVLDFLSTRTLMPPTDQHVAPGIKAEENLCASQGSTLNVSHVTPSDSLNCSHATATSSRVPPSPTVNTREALDVIMGMFQAPPLTEDPSSDISGFLTSGKPSDDANSSALLANSTAPVPFTVYQDDVSGVASHTLGKNKALRGRGLSENLPSAESLTVTSAGRQEVNVVAGWSRQDKTADEMSWLAACPNNTADFALAARCVSTPFAHKWDSDNFQGAVNMASTGREADENTFKLQKLSTIMEQNPADAKPSSNSTSQRVTHGRTIIEEGLSTLVKVPTPPPGSFFGARGRLGPSAARQPFTILGNAPLPTDQHMMSPEKECRHMISDNPSAMTPAPPADQYMASPEKERGGLSEDPLLLSDPWSSELISDLLAKMSPPLVSHPHCIIWQRRLPDIAAKKTISMAGKASLRVDRILGQGAFATVYQATDPASSNKMVLKVQKPANPWEFYIVTQLDRRLAAPVRHLFAHVHSAHIFTDGSVLLGELHSYGTLLNAANVYKNIGDKVMPQPLAIYFTICILRMLEELHAARIVHADVKPDNFMIGHRFVDSNDFETDGLVLIDLGQSIDMDLFPPGTAFTAKCLTSGFQCTEMLSGKPWNYQTDLFGAAGTVHVLLFGTYMQVVQENGEWRTRSTFRRKPHSDMWQHLFHTLLNVPACGPAITTLVDLRRRLTAVLQDDYLHKMASLKSRLLVLLLESCKAASRG